MTEIFPEERFFCNLTTSHSLDSGLSRYRFSSMSGSSEKVPFLPAWKLQARNHWMLAMGELRTNNFKAHTHTHTHKENPTCTHCSTLPLLWRFSCHGSLLKDKQNLMANIAELIRSRDHEIVQLKQRVKEKDIKIKTLEKKQRRLRRRFKRYKKKNKHFKSRRHDKSHAQTHGNAPPRKNVT